MEKLYNVGIQRTNMSKQREAHVSTTKSPEQKTKSIYDFNEQNDTLQHMPLSSTRKPSNEDTEIVSLDQSMLQQTDNISFDDIMNQLGDKDLSTTVNSHGSGTDESFKISSNIVTVST